MKEEGFYAEELPGEMDDNSNPLCISVVIVNYNAGQTLVDCIESALPQAAEVLIVDNASSDRSLEFCAERFPGEAKLKIMRNAANLGFAAACNIGAKAASESHVLFLNPDCILSRNALPRLLHVLETTPQAGMAGGLLTDQDGTEQAGGRRAVPTPWRSLVRAFGLYRFERYWPRLFFDFHLHKQPLPWRPLEVEAISGALMLVRQEAIRDVGPWDEGYFLHCEDLDWCMRFREKDWKILFVPEAPVVHYKGTCSRSRPIFVEWHKHRGMMRFYRKFFRQEYPGALMWLVAAGIWLRFGAIAIVHCMQHRGRLAQSR